MTRSIPMLIMLGYNKMHIYGFDSCLREGKHHAYEQEENDKKQAINIVCAERQFKCQIWMWVQAQEFMDMQKMIAEHCELAVYGDGLIAHIIESAFKLSKE